MQCRSYTEAKKFSQSSADRFCETYVAFKWGKAWYSEPLASSPRGDAAVACGSGHLFRPARRQ